MRGWLLMHKLRVLAVLGLVGCSPQVESPFAVTISLSPNAAQVLQSTGEQVELSATYYWRPKAGGPSHDESEFGNVLGGYPMGGEERRAEWSVHTVQFNGAHAEDERVKRGEGEMRVLLNVYSARLKSRDNILDCGIFDDALALASAGISIRCGLLSEWR